MDDLNLTLGLRAVRRSQYFYVGICVGVAECTANNCEK